jgi:hypothetical protein
MAKRKGQGRPVGYQVGPETRAAIAAARRGKKWDKATKAKIGEGVRKGGSNKVPFATRISVEADAELRQKANRAKLKLAPAIEAAIAAWTP